MHIVTLGAKSALPTRVTDVNNLTAFKAAVGEPLLLPLSNPPGTVHSFKYRNLKLWKVMVVSPPPKGQFLQSEMSPELHPE